MGNFFAEIGGGTTGPGLFVQSSGLKLVEALGASRYRAKVRHGEAQV
jgi:hypothetical protein